MPFIHYKKVVIKPNRQRKEFDAERIQELADGLVKNGLLHAPVLRTDENGTENVLVAGECRMKAMEINWMMGRPFKYNGELVADGMMPYTNIGQLDELAAEEAELEENAQRTDLTWQEKSAALNKLHTLRSKQAQAEGRVHTVADTALEVKGRGDGYYQATVRKEIIVAQHLSNPEVQKAKSTEEAFKIIKKQEEQAKNIELAATVGKTFTKSIHELYNESCIDGLRRMDAEQFDVILTDPPYGMGADSFGDGGGKLVNSEHHYKDDLPSWRKLMQEWMPLLWKVAKPQAHAYIYCDFDNFHELKKMMQEAGWYVFRTPFIHYKPNSGRVPLPDKGPRRQYETILYAIKGNKTTTGIYPDVLVTTADANLTHGAQKPVAAFADLLRRSVRAGDVVLDCFAGSGTIFPAAHQLKCKAVGFELNPEYYAMCYNRLQDLDKPQEAVSSGAGADSAVSAGLLKQLTGA